MGIKEPIKKKKKKPVSGLTPRNTISVMLVMSIRSEKHNGIVSNYYSFVQGN